MSSSKTNTSSSQQINNQQNIRNRNRTRLLHRLKQSNFTLSPRTRKPIKTHPRKRGLCYLHLVHPMYWKMARKVLGLYPAWMSIKAFLSQLMEQEWNEEQHQLLLISRLDLKVKGKQIHIFATEDPMSKLNYKELCSIIPDDNKVGGFRPTSLLLPLIPLIFQLLFGLLIPDEPNQNDTKRNFSNHKTRSQFDNGHEIKQDPDFSIDPLLASILLITLVIQFRRLGNRFFWRGNLATTALIPLCFRLLQTGHMLTSIDPEEVKMEPTWLICKITFLTMVIPRPKGFRWLLPSILFWNQVLQLASIALGYKYFCSMVDSKLPFNRLSTKEILADADQRAIWTTLVNNWAELSVNIQTAFRQ